MDPKVTVHLHTEATEHLTEVITPQVMEDTTRIARDTEVPIMAVTEAISSEVMAVTEATNLEDMAATEATNLEDMAATEATSSEVMEASEATSLEVMEATSPVEAMVTMNLIQPQAKKNTSQNEN